jgi:hypothetical protein
MAVAGYNFYENGIKLNTGLLATPTYTRSGLGEGVSGTCYFTAVDDAGNESVPGQQANFTTLVTDTGPVIIFQDAFGQAGTAVTSDYTVSLSDPAVIGARRGSGKLILENLAMQAASAATNTVTLSSTYSTTTGIITHDIDVIGNNNTTWRGGLFVSSTTFAILTRQASAQTDANGPRMRLLIRKNGTDVHDVAHPTLLMANLTSTKFRWTVGAGFIRAEVFTSGQWVQISQWTGSLDAAAVPYWGLGSSTSQVCDLQIDNLLITQL